MSIQLQPYVLQFGVGRGFQDFESIGRETEDATVDKFQEHGAPFHPNSNGRGFDVDR
ncbi:MAG: hypothetical protein WD971_03960 [Pirellulales bacterium]